MKFFLYKNFEIHTAVLVIAVFFRVNGAFFDFFSKFDPLTVVFIDKLKVVCYNYVMIRS